MSIALQGSSTGSIKLLGSFSNGTAWSTFYTTLTADSFDLYFAEAHSSDEVITSMGAFTTERLEYMNNHTNNIGFTVSTVISDKPAFIEIIRSVNVFETRYSIGSGLSNWYGSVKIYGVKF